MNTPLNDSFAEKLGFWQFGKKTKDKNPLLILKIIKYDISFFDINVCCQNCFCFFTKSIKLAWIMPLRFCGKLSKVNKYFG